MRAGEQRVAPRRRESARVEVHRVGGVARRLVQQQLSLGLRARTPRHEIHHTAQRRGPVEGRRGALDDLDLAEVHRRDLQQAQSLSRQAIERQAVGQQLRVATPEPLDAHVGATERGRCGGDPHAARLVEQHRDVAGLHRRLFLDILAADHLHPRRLLADAAVAAASGGDGDDGQRRGLLVQAERDRGVRACNKRQPHGVGCKPQLAGDHHVRACRQCERDAPGRVSETAARAAPHDSVCHPRRRTNPRAVTERVAADDPSSHGGRRCLGKHGLGDGTNGCAEHGDDDDDAEQRHARDDGGATYVGHVLGRKQSTEHQLRVRTLRRRESVSLMTVLTSSSGLLAFVPSRVMTVMQCVRDPRVVKPGSGVWRACPGLRRWRASQCPRAAP